MAVTGITGWFNVVSVPVPSPTGTRIGIYGDSISAGAGASTPSKAYYAIYETLTGLQVRSMSQYSRTVQEGVQSFNVTNSLENVVFSPTADQAQYNPVLEYPANSDYKYIFFRLGVNDCLQKPNSSTNVTTFKDTYRECLQEFLDKGWPRNRLKLVNISTYLGSVSEVQQAVIDYNQAISELGTEFNFDVIDLNTLDADNNRPSLYDDDVHPNDAGHNLHGEYLASLYS